MLRCVLSGIIVLLVASGAWAVIGQAQGFEIGAINVVSGGGIGSAEGGHQVLIGQEQRTVGSRLSGAGLQKETGVFVQTASTQGPRSSSVRQEAGIQGAQGQMTGAPSSPVRVQGQRMGVDFTTRISLPCGSGGASGTQSFVGGQTHTVFSPCGFSTESQVLGAVQHASVVAGPHGSPTVRNSLEVDLCQGQMAGVSQLPW